MNNRSTAALAVILMAVLFSASSVFVPSDDSSAAVPIYHVDSGGDSLEVKAGSTSSFDVLITNSNAFIDHDISDNIVIEVTVKVTDMAGNSVSGLSANVVLKDKSGNRAVLEGQESAEFVITAIAGEFVDRGNYKVTYTCAVADLQGNSLGQSLVVSRDVSLVSDSAASTYYNKFCGLYPNNLDGMLGEVWFTAIMSFVIIFLVGVVLSLIISPIISILMTTKTSPDRKELRKSLFRVFSFAFAVFGIARALCVMGLGNADAALVETISNMVYVLIVAYIVWKVYGAILDRISERIQARESRDALDNFLSFKPLFMYLGKILITLVTVFSIMSMFGFNMAAIITSAGLITLGITFGAQQILSQFFAGLLLLTTRPFKKGDLIQLNSSVVYRVRKVNVMNTELENWDNSDITIVPNNTLTSSSVKNITRDTLRTKAYIFVGVGYGVELDKARALMVEAAEENGHVIQDGSSAGPSTAIIDFQDSNILLRLCIWVDDYNVALGVGADLRDSIYKKFNAAGISIDYPQVVLHKADDKDD